MLGQRKLYDWLIGLNAVSPTGTMWPVPDVLGVLADVGRRDVSPCVGQWNGYAPVDRNHTQHPDGHLREDDGPPSPVKLVAIDLDGTLLRSDKRMTAKTVRAVRRVIDKGVRVVLASARPPRSVRDIYSHLGLDTFQVNYNGALIHDAPGQRHVFHEPLAPEVVKGVIRVARRIDRRVVVSLEILDKWYTDHVDEKLPTETSKVFAPDFIGPLEAFVRVPITKLMLLAPPEVMNKITPKVRSKFAGRIATAVSDRHVLQVIHPRVDKAYALERVARHYGVKRESVMAIGDAPNDIGMIKWAGFGVAMDNAWPTARSAARAIVPSNDRDGVAYALDRFVA